MWADQQLPKTPAQDTEHEIDINLAPDCSHVYFRPSIVNLLLTFSKVFNLHATLFLRYYYCTDKAVMPKTLLMIKLALLQSGDVHPNPGPQSDLLQIIAEKNHTPPLIFRKLILFFIKILTLKAFLSIQRLDR